MKSYKKFFEFICHQAEKMLQLTIPNTNKTLKSFELPIFLFSFAE